MRKVSAELVVGRDAVLAHVPALACAALPWGQQPEAADLPLFLAKPGRLRTVPTLLLLRTDGAQLAAAVLLFEYRGPLRRLFSSANRRGRRTVFAPMEDRVEAAALAARTLLERGARSVNIDIDLGPLGDDLAFTRRRLSATLHLQQAAPGAEWALHRGMKRFDLPLAADFDATLAQLGKRTRRNLRYYQRLCVSELHARFLPDASPTWPEFQSFNAECTYPADGPMLRWRFDMLTRQPNTFLAGLQDGDGHWLSLLGGRRRAGLTEIDWQMNRKGLERFSISTAMRSFLIAEETRRSSTSLSAEGGTVHSMAASFRPRGVDNLAVRRPSWLLSLLTWFLARRFPGMILTEALHKPWRRWTPCSGAN